MKSITVKLDSITDEISTNFDYEFTGESFFKPYDKPDLPEDFRIGLIVGSSGSGKSTLLSEFGEEEIPAWNPDMAICSHFESSDDAIDRLSAVGFSSIPDWMKPQHVLSTGQKFRADLAMRLKDNAVVDEFTSVVDRAVAKSCSVAIRRYVDKKDLKGLVFSSCHRDIIEWLQPDWVFDTDTGKLSVGKPQGQTLNWKSFLVRQRPGQCSVSITI